MKKLYYAAFLYMILGLAAGFFTRTYVDQIKHLVIMQSQRIFTSLTSPLLPTRPSLHKGFRLLKIQFPGIDLSLR